MNDKKQPSAAKGNKHQKADNPTKTVAYMVSEELKDIKKHVKKLPKLFWALKKKFGRSVKKNKKNHFLEQNLRAHCGSPLVARNLCFGM